MHIIPDTWSHFHMLVSVFPLVGLLFVMGFYVTGIVTKNDALNRFCLLGFGVLGILAIPTYYSGDGSMAMIAAEPNVTQDVQDRMFIHYGWGWTALALDALTGLVAFLVLWRHGGNRRISNESLHLVLG